MPPELENLLKQVQIEGTLNAKDFVSSIFFTEDSDYVREFRNDFKNKFIQPLSRQLKNFKPEDVRKIIDPFNISKDADDLAEDFKKYRKKIKEFLDMDFPEIDDESPKQKLKDTSVGDAIPDKVKEVEPTNIEEQQTFGPKELLVNLNDETKGFFVDLMKNFSSDSTEEFKESRKQMREYYDKYLANQEQLIALSEGTGILGTLAKVLAIGGVGALLLSTFWESHIKPWLEETFDINLDFFDKFEGFIEAIGKFFTMGATGAGGLLLKIQGKVFTSIADVLDNTIGSVLKAIFGETSTAGKIVSGGAKLFSGSFFARLAGNLFKGLGIVALKSIPVIGGLISLGFAYDRFQKGDTVGAVIDLVGGLADLLYFTPLAPLGLALSLGAAGLNMFLDLKYGGTGDGAAESKAKLGFLGDIATSIYKTLIKIPVIGGMIEGVTGLWNLLYSLAGGDTGGARKALEQMTKFPLLGALPSILLAFFDITDSPAEQGNQMNLPNFLQSFKKRVGQTVLSWFSWLPTSWQKSIAEFMGVPFEGTEETEVVNNEQLRQKTLDRMRELPKESYYTEEGSEKLKQMREDVKEAYQKALKEKDENDTFYGKILSDRYAQSEEQVKYLSEQLIALNERTKKYEQSNPMVAAEKMDQAVENIENLTNELVRQRETDKTLAEETTKVEDFYKPASGKSTLIFDQNTNTRFQTAPDDDVLAMKPNGIFDRALKEIKMVASDINNNINKLNQALILNNKQPTQAPVVNVAQSGNGYTGKEYLMDSERDPIFNARVNWWGQAKKVRATLND